MFPEPPNPENKCIRLGDLVPDPPTSDNVNASCRHGPRNPTLTETRHWPPALPLCSCRLHAGAPAPRLPTSAPTPRFKSNRANLLSIPFYWIHSVQFDFFSYDPARLNSSHSFQSSPYGF